MHLTICVILAIVFGADGSNPKCPRDRPTLMTPKCSTDSDCQDGYSCCPFNGGNYCSSTNSETCILNGHRIWRGATVLVDDKCTECSCLGYDQLACTSEPCNWQRPTNLRAMSMAKCPVQKSRFLNQTCKDSNDCHRDQHCCPYPTGNVCASRSENVCTYGEKKLRAGESIILADNCTFCECAGFESMLCIDDDCSWSSKEIKEKTPFCPMKRLPTEVTRCHHQRECSPEHNCCDFEDGKYCVSDRNNVCHFKGKKLMKLETVTMDDKCTVCECRGYDIIMCNDVCKKKKDSDNRPKQ